MATIQCSQNIICRNDPVIMKLNTPEFKAIFTDEVCCLKNIFDKYGYELRLAGGPVRDILLGNIPKDLDFATTALPSEMKEMFEKENIRMINLNGEKHGTVTPRIYDKENFEVTTLRIDVVTDGRHAEVKYTSDWKLDANRRDLTINSMFLGFDGSVYDYFYGYEDLKARRVVFVGDASQRIKEDYLRILRYFRFYGRVAEEPYNHDSEILTAIKNNADGLQKISGERIWTELKKILSGKFAGDLLKTMLSLDIGKYLGLPEIVNILELERIWNGFYKDSLHPISFLTSLLSTDEDITFLNNRLKFSAYDRDLGFFLMKHRTPKISDKPLLPYQKLYVTSKLKNVTAREYIIETLKYQNNFNICKQFKEWDMPMFPRISVSLLNKNGVTSPKLYAIVINELKNIWAENDFNMTIEEIEGQIPIVLSYIENSVQYEHYGKRAKKI